MDIKIKTVITGEDSFFGPGVYELLKGIEDTGSIQAASAEMRMSYTKCWRIIQREERETGFAFLNRKKGGKDGGKSELTEEGRVFMQKYIAMDADIKAYADKTFKKYF